ncbi:unnamed protein product [Lymnaea stagnalis]|uniref:Uncharacterized protein n=1 Tax=Lymnaea stagnalis TaxID=6523 RepID=A0AAV2HK34_LYMST
MVFLRQQQDECAKNPGHPDFIPFQAFTVKHLPQQFQDNDIFELIKTIGDLTVRLSVTHVSVSRPEVFPETITPFPYNDKKGSNELRTATGWVDKVRKYSEYSEKFCPCEQCLASENPSKVWGELHVITAAHVVFDDNEAKHTSFRWGFNEHESPVVTFKGGHVRDIDPLADRCTVVCVTCDLGLIDKAICTLAQRDSLHKKIQEKDRGLDENDNLVVVVSHPHGFPKQVTVGFWTERNLGTNNETRYVYTASTCPGSGGAPVYILSRNGLPSYHCHSGYSPHKGNFSCVWLG